MSQNEKKKSENVLQWIFFLIQILHHTHTYVIANLRALFKSQQSYKNLELLNGLSYLLKFTLLHDTFLLCTVNV